MVKSLDVYKSFSPQQKKKKAQLELKTGIAHTNDGEMKIDPHTNQPLKLTKEQKKYRQGLVNGIVECQKLHLKKKNQKKIKPVPKWFNQEKKQKKSNSYKENQDVDILSFFKNN